MNIYIFIVILNDKKMNKKLKNERFVIPIIINLTRYLMAMRHTFNLKTSNGPYARIGTPEATCESRETMRKIVSGPRPQTIGTLLSSELNTSNNCIDCGSQSSGSGELRSSTSGAVI